MPSARNDGDETAKRTFAQMVTMARKGSDEIAQYSAAKRYKETYGNLLIPQSYVEKSTGIKLGKWTNKIRVDFKKGALPPDRFDILDDLGMIWSAR